MVDRKDVTALEARFLFTDPIKVFGIGDQLRTEGHPAPVVAGIENWLLRKALGYPDRTASDTRARYRKILASLNGKPPRRRRSQRGVIPLRASVAMAGATGAAELVASGHPRAALLAALLDVTYNEGEAVEVEPAVELPLAA